ncbi:MAG: DUF1351 domain-containing protein [Candidatus Riflebacteria bacterium]|nr:DUF1351 domain-containing protein [Candidatus Riflebacteria bacterium]
MKAYYERVQDEIDGICPTKGKLSTNKVEKKMNELQVTIIPAQISANLAEIKADLLENLKQYDIEVSIETLPEAKKMATDLNKLAGEIDKRRKDVKKELSAPVDVFNAQAVELAKLILDSREKILKQVAVFEDKQREYCKKLLQNELDALYIEYEVAKEYQTGNIEKLAILSNLTDKANLTKSAIEKVAEIVKADKAVQDMVESRKANLNAITERAGVVGGIYDKLIEPFIKESEAIYTANLNGLIDGIIKQQKTAEDRIRAEAERKAREEADRILAETHKREEEAAKQLAQAVEIAAERDNAAKLAEQREAQAKIDAEKQKEALELAQKQAAEEKRKTTIERAMLEMERAEIQAAKESKKPELGKSCRLFFITAQIKLRCEPTATKEDAENTLKEIIYESHGEVLRIDSVIGE